MLRQSDFELLRELEDELAAMARPRRRLRVRIVYGRSVHREYEWEAFGREAFDPSVRPAGTTFLFGFDPGDWQLKPSHGPIINRFVRTVIARIPATPRTSTIRIDVEGHEDDTGDPARYQFIGLERAKKVAGVLHRRLEAIPAAQLSSGGRDVVLNITSRGPTQPFRSNVTTGGRALNRRVELRIHIIP
jgi:outer membrane protein OmpA-like peptidoglycan-associated protein